MNVLLTIIILTSHGQSGVPVYGPPNHDDPLPAQFLRMDSLDECRAVADAVILGVQSAARGVRAFTSCTSIEPSTSK